MSEREPVGSWPEEAEQFMARMHDIVPDEPLCEVCEGEGCAACVKGISPTAAERIYLRARAEAGRELKEARRLLRMPRGDRLEALEARIREQVRRCQANPQHEGTHSQVSRFGALLQETDIMGKPWPKRATPAAPEEKSHA